MQFRILGQVVALDHDRRLPIKGGHDAHLLGRLLLNADRPVSREVLIDALWLRPPASARRVIENSISRLRKDLGDHDHQLIRFAGSSYEFRLGAHQLDWHTVLADYNSAVVAAESDDHQAAVGSLEHALSQWRGPVLDGVPEELVIGLRAGFDARHRDVTRLLVQSYVQLGRYADALQRLPELIAVDPLNDRLHALRLRALCGLGRVSEALRIYPDLHRQHRDHDGLEPSTELRDLHQRLLMGDHRTVAGSGSDRPVPHQLPPMLVTAIGRDELVAEIEAEVIRPTVRAPSPFGPHIAVLLGPGGVGKSTVETDVGRRSAQRFVDGQLYCDLRGMGSRPVDPYDVIAAFLRALGVRSTDIPPEPAERLALYRSRLAQTRTLIVLDDARDESQLRPLIPNAAGCVVLITSRRRLVLPGVRRWSVTALGSADGVALLHRVVGADRFADAPDAATRIADACDGLPLALSVAGARLAAHPEWEVTDFSHRLIGHRRQLDEFEAADQSVRASIGLSCAALDQPARSTFRRLGLLPVQDWPRWAAGALLGVDDEAVRPVLDQLVDVHLVAAVGRDALGQDRFGLHALTAEYARELAADQEQPGELDRALDRLLAGWLERVTAAGRSLTRNDIGWFDVEIGSVLAAIGQSLSTGRIETAARLALGVFGYLAIRNRFDELERVLRQVVERTRTAAPPESHARVLHGLIEVLNMQSHFDQVQPLAGELLRLAEDADDQLQQTRARLLLSFSALTRGQPGRAQREIDRALSSCDERTPVDLRSLVHSRKGLVLADLGWPVEAAEQHRLAWRLLSNQPEQWRVVPRVLGPLAEALMEAGRLAEAAAALAEAAAVAAAHDDQSATLGVERCRVLLALHSADPDGAADHLRACFDGLEHRFSREVRALVLRHAGDLAFVRGRPAEAITALSEALPLIRRTGQPLELIRILYRLQTAHRADGDHERAAALGAEWRQLLTDLELPDAVLRVPPYLRRYGEPAARATW